MRYAYRKGDKIFMKVIVGASHVPLQKGETKRIFEALKNGEEGLMVLKFGLIRLDKVNGIVPDLDRMESYNENGIREVASLPDLQEHLLADLDEKPQELDMPREGELTHIKKLL